PAIAVRLRLADTVQGQRLGRLLAEVEGLASMQLHARRQLVAGNARLQFGRDRRMLVLVFLVELAQQVVPQALCLGRNGRRGIEIEDRSARVAEVDALVERRQEATRPVACAVDREYCVIAK